MKKIHVLFFLVFLAANINTASAQKELTEGNITLSITDIKSDDPQTQTMMQMMKSSTINVQFNSIQSLLTMDMMNGMMKTRTLIQNNDKTSLTLMDMMGQKMMTKISAEEVAKAEKEAKEKATTKDEKIDYDITYDKSVTKKIMGYDCYKANIIIKNKEAKDLKISLFVTKKLKLPKALTQQMDDKVSDFKLKEFPLEATIEVNDKNGKSFSVTVAATKFETSVDKNVFNLDTEGYKEMTPEEMKKMGGMGF
ncbi:MAG TPA: hypothetical protein ENJ53_10410 [Phaeodactylibacter sp.]|nr:hypothetical protein [Phaeodactylibacter sp.]